MGDALLDKLLEPLLPEFLSLLGARRRAFQSIRDQLIANANHVARETTIQGVNAALVSAREYLGAADHATAKNIPNLPRQLVNFCYAAVMSITPRTTMVTGFQGQALARGLELDARVSTHLCAGWFADALVLAAGIGRRGGGRARRDFAIEIASEHIACKAAVGLLEHLQSNLPAEQVAEIEHRLAEAAKTSAGMGAEGLAQKIIGDSEIPSVLAIEQAADAPDLTDPERQAHAALADAFGVMSGAREFNLQTAAFVAACKPMTNHKQFERRFPPAVTAYLEGHYAALGSAAQHSFGAWHLLRQRRFDEMIDRLRTVSSVPEGKSGK